VRQHEVADIRRMPCVPHMDAVAKYINHMIGHMLNESIHAALDLASSTAAGDALFGYECLMVYCMF